VSNSLTTLVILVTMLHVVVFGVMIAIRLWPTGRVRTPRATAKQITPCAVCGEPATHRDYDGLDPDEQHDPSTGRAWSYDTAHYQPLCAAH
jgi:hypothetical protein